jgi:hypothetical protein
LRVLTPIKNSLTHTNVCKSNLFSHTYTDDGDRSQLPTDIDFCRSVVNYSIPIAYDQIWSDMTAKNSYELLSPYCVGNVRGLTSMHNALCAMAFFKVSEGKVLKPCQSMCADFGALCGIPSSLSCFSDQFYSIDPDCFSIDYTQKLNQAIISQIGDAAFQAAEQKRKSIAQCPQNFTCVNGNCIEGSCACLRGWFGRDCAVEIPTCPNYCSDHGICQNQLCKCLPGWSGDDCSTSTALCQFDCLVDGWRTESCCTTVENLLHPLKKQDAFVSPGCGTERKCSKHGRCVKFVGFEACVCETGFGDWDCSNRLSCPLNCTGIHTIETFLCISQCKSQKKFVSSFSNTNDLSIYFYFTCFSSLMDASNCLHNFISWKFQYQVMENALCLEPRLPLRCSTICIILLKYRLQAIIQHQQQARDLALPCRNQFHAIRQVPMPLITFVPMLSKFTTSHSLMSCQSIYFMVNQFIGVF